MSPHHYAAIWHQKKVPIAQLNRFYKLEEKSYLSIGGGLGSFTWVNLLRVSGIPPDAVSVIGFEREPYARYRQLCRNSQIAEHERLRSNSDSCPDNLWGWPGYAVREIGRDFIRGSWGNAARISWQIFNEPVVQT